MKALPILIGLDLGTSALKCTALDAGGALLAASTRAYPTHSPHPGWAEQDPEDWYTAACAAVNEVTVRLGKHAGRVATLGLSGQMHTTVCSDAGGQPLRPAVIWSDRRSAEIVERVQREIPLPQMLTWTGNCLATGFPLATWLWLQENEPGLMHQTRWLMCAKDTLRLRMTGQFGTEPGDASATALYDPFNQKWCDPLLNHFGLDAGFLPPLRSSSAVAGGLLPEPARLMGLKSGTPVIYGSSDQAMQALGSGIIEEGQVSAAVGTGGQVFAPLARPRAESRGRLHLFCHALPGLWHLEAAILAAGDSLAWLREAIAPGLSFADLADQAAAVPPGADGLFFLPFLSGERTPYFNPRLLGGFVGLSLQHSRVHLVRAVMEGVVCAMRQGLDLVRGMGIIPPFVITTGAAASHDLWLQLQSDIYGLPVHSLPASAYLAASGAARLAGLGQGIYSNPQEACQAGLAGKHITLPDPVRASFYADLFGKFMELAESRLTIPFGPGKPPADYR